MIFEVLTLIDITETRARRGEDLKKVKQQQNYMTFIQTLGLRTNFKDITVPSVENRDISKLDFGSNYKGKQNVWRIVFEPEREGSISIDQLISDFDIIPVIQNLDETVDLEMAAFRSSKNTNRNIIFSIIDK